MLLRYEATFDGLLTAIAVCLREGKPPEILMPDLGQQSLLPCTDISAEPGIRALFQRHLCQTTGADAGITVFENAYAAFLSDDEGVGLPIYRYFAAALRLKCDPAGDLLDRDIARVVSAAYRVRSQAHAYLGLVRFRQISPALYLADITPDYHILPLILAHFCERLPDQPFVIRDLRRDLAAVHVPGRSVRIFVLAPPEGFSADPVGQDLTLPQGTPVQSVQLANINPLPVLLLDEVDPFNLLWRRYLNVLTIPERRNLKLQRANMPQKYWKYLTEQPGER